MSNPETIIKNDILLMIGKDFSENMRVWSNNTGACKDARGQLIRYGLPGSSDILGVIAPKGTFLGIEVKTATGRQRPDQKNFEAMVRAMGGLYLLVRSVAEARAMLEEVVKYGS